MEVVPTPAPTESWLRWPPPGKEFWTRVLQRALIILIFGGVIFIVLLGVQLRHASSAQRFVKEAKYIEAAEKYLLASEAAHFFSRDHYLHMVSWCYLHGKDPVRAMDFAMRLARDFPDSDATVENRVIVQQALEAMNLIAPVDLKANTQLGQARAAMRASYTKMVTALKNNKGGVSAEVMGEYVKYKVYYDAYKLELVRAYREVEKGADPEQIDGPRPGGAK
jgi:hypothetical protein